MKKIITFTLTLIITNCIFSQAPQKMSFQAVIRNSTGALVPNQNVGIRLSILFGSATGNPVYIESHTPTTNANGLVTLEIGGGTVNTGSFSAVSWSDGIYFLKTETDLAGGTNYSITTTSQFLSVPYALSAGSSADNKWKANGNNIHNNNTGNIGIGTNTPTVPLQFADELGSKISLYGSKNVQYGFGIQPGVLQIYADGANNGDIAFGGSDTVEFKEKMRLNGYGNLGLGIWDIDYTGYGHGGTNRIFEIQNKDSATDAQSQLVFSSKTKMNSFFNLSSSLGGITWALPNTSNTLFSDKRMAYIGSNAFVNTNGNNGGNLSFWTNEKGSLYNRGGFSSNGTFRIEGPTVSNISALSVGGLGKVQVDAPGIVGGRFSIQNNGNVGFGIDSASETAYGNSSFGKVVEFKSTSRTSMLFTTSGNIISGSHPIGSFVFALPNTTFFQDKRIAMISGDFIKNSNNIGNGGFLRFSTNDSGTLKERMSINPKGTVKVEGYTKLGSDAPAIKVLKLTGTTNASEGGSVTITHGVKASKILSVSVLVEYSTNSFIPNSYTPNSGYEYTFFSTGSSIVVWNKTGNSSAILSKPIKVLITYEE